MAIDSFNVEKRISFNTYFYSFVKGIIRQTITSSGFFKFQKSIVSEFETDNTLLESDFIIDIYKLLDNDELLAYKLNLQKNTSNNKLLQSAKIKIKDYLSQCQ
jgi:hypothetical protein